MRYRYRAMSRTYIGALHSTYKAARAYAVRLTEIGHAYVLVERVWQGADGEVVTFWTSRPHVKPKWVPL